LSPLLEVRDATKRFGGVVANDGISLTVGEGSIVGLIGPNGSGKTTLFNSIAGSHPIDGGSIRFAGHEISTLRVAEVARLGLVRTYQQTRIFRQISCLDNLLISAPQRETSVRDMLGQPGAEDRARAEELLAFVGLANKRDLPAGSLSFGQQKLLEFAMALMNEPRMLLLDEPTAGINPTLINGLVDRLKRARSELGITLFVIEHNMRVVMNLAEHIYCLAHGELLAEGRPEEVQKDPRVLAAYLGAQ
jgi:ABC-type branched-subunit amino acid transport system ATPase component